MADRPWRGKRTKQSEAVYEVIALTRNSKDTRNRKARSTKAQPEHQPKSGYEVADLTQGAKDTRETKEKSTQVHSHTVAKQPEAGYEVADLTQDTNHT